MNVSYSTDILWITYYTISYIILYTRGLTIPVLWMWSQHCFFDQNESARSLKTLSQSVVEHIECLYNNLWLDDGLLVNANMTMWKSFNRCLMIFCVHSIISTFVVNVKIGKYCLSLVIFIWTSYLYQNKVYLPTISVVNTYALYNENKEKTNKRIIYL